MTHPWIRLYREALHDPKLVTLPDRQFRAWVNCLMIADDAGVLPSRRDIAVHMRVSVIDVDQLLCDLVEAELIDADAIIGPVTVYRMHGWSNRQYVSDNSTARVRKHRENKTKQTCNGDETLQKRHVNAIESESDTESESDLTSHQPAPEPREVSLKFDMNGKASRGVSPRLKGIAEGLGLNVDALATKAECGGVKQANAYFRALAHDELRRLLPNAPDPILKTALTYEGEAARQSVYALLLAVPHG